MEVNEMNKIGKDKKANVKIEKKWDNAIAKANGMMIKVPDEYIEKTAEFKEIHNALLKDQKEMDEKNSEFKHLNENFWYDLLKKLKDDGAKKPEGDFSIGLDEEAAKEGVFIINFIPASPRGGSGPMMM